MRNTKQFACHISRPLSQACLGSGVAASLCTPATCSRAPHWRPRAWHRATLVRTGALPAGGRAPLLPADSSNLYATMTAALTQCGWPPALLSSLPPSHCHGLLRIPSRISVTPSRTAPRAPSTAPVTHRSNNSRHTPSQSHHCNMALYIRIRPINIH